MAPFLPSLGVRKRRRQGYRSAVFYTSEKPKHLAEETVAEVDATGLWPGKVMTVVIPAGDFWQVEPEHQDYLERRPAGYTSHYIRPKETTAR